MKDLLLAARRGIECLLDRQVLLAMFGSSFLWTAVNKFMFWLLIGPALVVLFRIALKALREDEPEFDRSDFGVAEDLPVSLVAGILFALPFPLWVMVNQACRGVVAATAGAYDPGIPVLASVALFIHFAFHILAFAIIADRRCGVLEAAARSRELADLPGRGGSRLLGLGRHLVFTSVLLAVLLGASAVNLSNDVVGWAFTALAAPPAVMMLTAWYLQLTAPAPPVAAEGSEGETLESGNGP